MARIAPLLPLYADANTKEIYSELEHKMGKIPNLFLTMGHSAAALEAYLGMSKCLDNSTLSFKTREAIALYMGELNGCTYCIAAHTALAKARDMIEPEILAARRGQAEDSRVKAILKFVGLVVSKRAQVETTDVAALKAAGLSDREVVDVFLAISSNMFTNYFNIITEPDIDFPLVPKV